MIRIDAVAFSWAGDKFLGQRYEDIDCQKLVEKMMAEVGLRMDLGGSNSWYREITRNGWTGTPEECVRVFGCVPKGAILFILGDVGPGTPERFRHDGVGDATHMGVKTGRGAGAIHSSKSRGGVVDSEFRDRTVPNGGWNRVGLYNRFDYGKSVNWMLDHIGIGEKKEEAPMREAETWSENGNPVNLRSAASVKADRLAKVPVGQTVEVLMDDGEWSRVRWGKITGWMMSEFLREIHTADDSGVPAEDFADGDEDPQFVTIRISAGQAAYALPVLEDICQQIVAQAGRG